MKITAIVPAHNEERHIYDVLTALSHSSLLDEIICVNDGSTDSTLKQIKKVKKVLSITLRKNHGKGYAIAKGIQKSTGDILLLFDADLQYLNENHISQLLHPLIKHEYDISLGYPTYYKSFDKMMNFVTGERAYFKKDLIPLINQIKKKGYGLEIYLNYIFKNKKIKVVPLKGVRHFFKHEKQSIETAAKLSVVEGFDILLEFMNQSRTIPSILKNYIAKLYVTDSPIIQRQIKKVLKSVKKSLLNSIS